MGEDTRSVQALGIGAGTVPLNVAGRSAAVEETLYWS